MMRLLIYVGPAPSRALVLHYGAQLARHVATALTLVTGGGEERRPLLDDALRRLEVPSDLPVSLEVLPGDAQESILRAAAAASYDLVVFGRLNQRLGRLLPGPRSKAIAQRLEPSVLRIHGTARPIRRILLGSGGDHHTFDDIAVAARLAVPLQASVTLLHVVSQQSVIFEGFADQSMRPQDLLATKTPEASVLMEATSRLRAAGVPVELKARVGPVIDEILAELRVGSYDLLVIGAHRVSSALDRILLEDITGDLLDLSPLPVLVVKKA